MSDDRSQRIELDMQGNETVICVSVKVKRPVGSGLLVDLYRVTMDEDCQTHEELVHEDVFLTPGRQFDLRV